MNKRNKEGNKKKKSAGVCDNQYHLDNIATTSTTSGQASNERVQMVQTL